MLKFLIFYLIFFLIPLSFYTIFLIFFPLNLNQNLKIFLFFFSVLILFLFYIYPGIFYKAREKFFIILKKENQHFFDILNLCFLSILFIILNTSLFKLKYYIFIIYFFEIIFPFYARKR